MRVRSRWAALAVGAGLLVGGLGGGMALAKPHHTMKHSHAMKSSSHAMKSEGAAMHGAAMSAADMTG
jgi:hypothetical protein